MSLKKTCPHCGAVIGAFGSAFERHQFVEHSAIYDPASDTVLGCSGPIERGEINIARIDTIELDGCVPRDQAVQKARRDIPGLG